MSEQQRNRNTLQPVMVGALAIHETAGVIAPPAEEGLLPRFSVSRAPFVQESLAFVQRRIQEAQATDSAIVGATAFGSTVKGYATPESSDVDVNVFIDADELGISLRNDVRPTDIHFPSWHPFDDAHGRWNIDREYKEKMYRAFEPRGDSRSELPVSPAVIPISTGLIALAAEREAQLTATQTRYRELQQATPPSWVDKMADWSQISISPETLQSIPGLTEAIRADDELGNRIDVLTVAEFLVKIAVEENTEFARMRPVMLANQRVAPEIPVRLFGLAITPGLAAYRRKYLDQIAQSENPDQVWQFFSKRLAKFENSSKHPRDISKIPYPRTLAEAYELYS